MLASDLMILPLEVMFEDYLRFWIDADQKLVAGFLPQFTLAMQNVRAVLDAAQSGLLRLYLHHLHRWVPL